MTERRFIIQRGRKQWGSLLCLFLLVGSHFRCSGGSEEASDANLRLAPDFVLRDVNGRNRKLSGYRGKVVILDFWATWCAPCRMVIPHFVDLYEQYRGSGLEVIGVAMDPGGAKVVKPFVEEYGVSYTTFIGNWDVARRYGGLRGIPTIFVITREGRIFRRYVGVPPNPRDVFERDVTSLLSL